MQIADDCHYNVHNVSNAHYKKTFKIKTDRRFFNMRERPTAPIDQGRFTSLTIETQDVAFVWALPERRTSRTDKPLSKATLLQTLNAVRKFYGLPNAPDTAVAAMAMPIIFGSKKRTREPREPRTTGQCRRRSKSKAFLNVVRQ